MMASAWSAVIGGGVPVCAVASAGSVLGGHSAPVQLTPGSANAGATPKPPKSPIANAPPATVPVTTRPRFPVCNVISSYRQREPNSDAVLLLGASDLGADRNGQPLVPIRIGIQIPGVTRRFGDALRLQRADQRAVRRAELHLGH